MKTILISLLTATLLGLAFRFSGRAFEGTDFTAILFTTGLVAWTLNQYGRRPQPLMIAPVIQLPVQRTAIEAETRSVRLAA